MCGWYQDEYVICIEMIELKDKHIKAKKKETMNQKEK